MPPADEESGFPGSQPGLKRNTSKQKREEVQATELFERARKVQQGRERDRMMQSVINRFPHTDAAIRAMRELDPIEKN